MKKFIVTICLAAGIAISANAQFHIELGLNGNMPQGDFADVYDLGVGFYIEPKYALTENIDLGLLLGSNGFAGGDLTGGANASVDAAAIAQITPTATYRFMTGKVSPYAGAAIGIYTGKVAGASALGGGAISEESVTEFGFAPRVGVYVGRLNLGAAYNLAGDIKFLQFNLGVRILSRD